MKNRKTKRTSKLGMPPGSKVYIGQDRNANVSISTFVFNLIEYRKYDSEDFRDYNHQIEKPTYWLNVNGVHNVALVDEICQKFGIHPLTVEDILNTFQRPKLEIFDNYIYCVLKMLKFDASNGTYDDEQVSLILTKDSVISFQEEEGDVFNPIRERITRPDSRLRYKKADYLFYLLLDIIVDNYIDIIEYKEKMHAELDLTSSHIKSETILKILQDDKNETLMLRKWMHPLKEAIAKVNRSECNLIDSTTLPFYGDLQDHIIAIVENLDVHRQINEDLKDSYHSFMTLRMNRVMEVLTIISSIFIPLTFIAGIYGMNFENMPELKWKYGYFFVMFGMAIVAFAMIYWFKRKKWI